MSTKDTKNTKWMLKYIVRGYDFVAIQEKRQKMKSSKCFFVLLLPFTGVILDCFNAVFP